jgi:hypothetical protein
MVGSYGITRVGTCPEEHLILSDLRISSGLEGLYIVGAKLQPTLVIEPVDPCLRVWLGTNDWPNVVRFSIVYLTAEQSSQLIELYMASPFHVIISTMSIRSLISTSSSHRRA